MCQRASSYYLICDVTHYFGCLGVKISVTEQEAEQESSNAGKHSGIVCCVDKERRGEKKGVEQNRKE